MIWTLLVFCIFLDVTRELFFKQSSRVSGSPSIGFRLAKRQVKFTVAQLTWIGAGILIWAIELVFWARVLAYLPLNVAFPIMSLTYAATPVAAKYLFGEAVSQRRWYGIVLITIGSMMIGVLEAGA